jgi:hypothetical protein
MKKNRLLIVGIVVLLFAGVASIGNYLQWSSATQVSADIVTAREQWVRRGENSVNLDIKYPVGPDFLSGTVNLMVSDLEEEGKDGKINVYYLNKDPERVIPVSVLKGKQRAIPIIGAIGAALTVLGYFRRKKMQGSVLPAP